MRPRTRPETPRPAPKRLATSIEIDAEAARIRVVDHRVFRDDRRPWCRALAEIAAARPGVVAAGIDLADGSCAIDFAAGTTAAAMAEAFAASIREAGPTAEDRPASRTRWPFRRAEESWTHLIALTESSGSAPAIRTARMTDDPRVLAIDVRPPEGRRRTVEVPLDGSGPLRALADFDSAQPAATPPDSPPSMLVRGPKRLFFLALGWATFGMTFVGLMIPGVPTVPFLMLTGYYFARSSPGLHDWLVNTRVFGRVIREWEEHGGLSKTSKTNLVLLTLVAVATSLALAGPSLVVLGIVAACSSAGILGILRLPGLEREPAIDGIAPGTLALPAPTA